MENEEERLENVVESSIKKETIFFSAGAILGYGVSKYIFKLEGGAEYLIGFVTGTLAATTPYFKSIYDKRKQKKEV